MSSAQHVEMEPNCACFDAEKAVFFHYLRSLLEMAGWKCSGWVGVRTFHGCSLLGEWEIAKVLLLLSI